MAQATPHVSSDCFGGSFVQCGSPIERPACPKFRSFADKELQTHWRWYGRRFRCVDDDDDDDDGDGDGDVDDDDDGGGGGDDDDDDDDDDAAADDDDDVVDDDDDPRLAILYIQTADKPPTRPLC